MTTQQKKELAIFGGCTLILLFWGWRHGWFSFGNNDLANTPYAGNSYPDTYGSNGYNINPETITFDLNPSAFGPQTYNGNINFIIPSFNGINQNYMPLFGFVGMAQGTLYQ